MRRLAFFAAVLLSGCVPVPQPDGTLPKSVTLETLEHRGHWYVCRGGYTGHFMHSPDCPCQKRRRIAEDPEAHP